jgi:hypothetical protein
MRAFRPSILLMLCLLGGCSTPPPPAVPLAMGEGTVTLDGVPLPGVVIRCSSPLGDVSVISDDRGHFSANAIPTGEYKVAVHPRFSMPGGGDNPKGGKAVSKPVVVPTKYHKPESSGLVVKISTDGPPITLTLVSR